MPGVSGQRGASSGYVQRRATECDSLTLSGGAQLMGGEVCRLVYALSIPAHILVEVL